MISDERVQELIDWLSNVKGLDKAMAGTEILALCTELLWRRKVCKAAVEMRDAMMARTSRDKYSYVVHQENVKAFDEVVKDGKHE